MTRQRDDHQRDRNEVVEGRHTGGGHQDDEDLLGREGRRRDRVGAEDREGDALGEALLPELLGSQRMTDEQSFQRGVHGFSAPGYCSARKAASSTTGSRVTGPVASTSARRIVALNGNGAV